MTGQRTSAMLLLVVYAVSIALVLLCAFLVPAKRIVGTGDDGQTESGSSSSSTNDTFRQAVPALDSAKRDCANEMVFSVLDGQCQTVCQGPETYVSRNGICVNVITQDTTAVRNECSAQKGVLAYLIGDPQFGKTDLLCLSVDPGIQPNDPEQPNRLCVNGTIDIDYRKQYPTLDGCRCATGYQLVRVPATSSIRERGVCVKRALANAIAEGDS